MFKLNSVLFKFKTIRCKNFLSQYITTDTNLKEKLSVRQKALELARKKYEYYKHIFYSSHLEVQEEHIGTHEKTKKQYSPEFPKNWMEDYEYYSGGNEANVENNFGTADPYIPPSNVPCSGCGALLHCSYSKHPGFLPSEIFKGRTQNELKTIICQRCHFLKYYNQALDVEVTPESYIKTISSIKSSFALAIVIVDLLDFPCSIWPDIHELLGHERPVFIVGNKVDLLPRDRNSYLDHVKECLTNEVLKTGFDRLNVKYVSLISAKTGYGIEELITKLHKIWGYKGDVYLLGCTNVGKSSLFNILLNSDYSRPELTGLIRKATTCPWPGTTLKMLKFPIYRPSESRVHERFRRLNSEKFVRANREKLRAESAKKMGKIADAIPMGTVTRTVVKYSEKINDMFAMSKGTQPITTFNERNKEYKLAKWLYDTPGVLHPQQITNLLTAEELEELQPKQMISPRCYRLKPGMSLFIAGLSRVDYIESDSNDLNWIQVFLFASFDLPTMIVDTDYALDIYNKYLNTPLMKVPMGNDERMKRWPGLQCHSQELIVKGYTLKSNMRETNCSGDIILSSSGWISLHIPVDVKCTFRAWTPHAKGIYLRTPSLVPYAKRLIGKRIQNSLAYNVSKPFVFKK